MDKKIYKKLISNHGMGTVKSLGWSSIESQHKRFEVIYNNRPEAATSLLDVGAGYGDFLTFLKFQESTFDYTGIEPFEPFYQEAVKNFGEEFFRNTDLMNYNPKRNYDYVIASGLFWRDVEDWNDIFIRSVEKMMCLSRLGVSFNLLSTYSNAMKNPKLRYSNPAEIVELIGALGEKFMLIHNYHKTNKDFTCVLYK
ncbi:MAG: class I SAM-dependent methyltransferase [Crocinitomicaceae bacterium]|nr:class I SAM-dependent methyltransferase [Crocinitomicaceae bacterium]